MSHSMVKLVKLACVKSSQYWGMVPWSRPFVVSDDVNKEFLVGTNSGQVVGK